MERKRGISVQDPRDVVKQALDAPGSTGPRQSVLPELREVVKEALQARLRAERARAAVPDAGERRILTIYAHPDDAEIWAGGALLAHRAAGDRTAICVLTHGDDERGPEAREGAARLGAHLYHLALRDRAVRAEAAAIEAVAEVLRAERPQIILTHWSGDSHPDHVATWQIVHGAILLAEQEGVLRALYWSDAYDGLGAQGLFTPDCLVDVTDQWEAKLEAIRAHQSQNPEYYVAMIERMCALHGARARVPYAEGFRRVPMFGRSRQAVRTLWDDR